MQNLEERFWQCRDLAIPCGRRTLVMGVLNITPDSFSDGGRYLDVERAVARTLEMIAEGADIIDVGGESTRPGAEPIPVEEEIRRVVPAVEAIRRETDVPISIDTRKAAVARAALEAGGHIVNDITALGDPAMAEVVADSGAGLVLMHMQGTPETMQHDPSYDDAVSEVVAFLARRMEAAQAAGVAPDRLCLDPGIGFGKRLPHNLALIAAAGRLRALGAPVLLGVSRKSFLEAISGVPLEHRLPGSLAAAVAGVLAGADAIRAHDVRETRRALDVADALRPWHKYEKGGTTS